MLDVEGFILVGGASSRMGADKSRLVLDGQTGVERIADSMRSMAGRISLVGSLQDPSQSALPNIPDLHNRWGPLGGIHAALTAARADWCLIVACDLPFVTSEMFERLSKDIDESIDAIVPLQDDARPQPLCALYRRAPCLRAAEQSIANDEHSPRALLDKVPTRYVPFSELSDLKGAEHFFFNVNTPENYEHAKQVVRLLQNRDLSA
jgi:molybdopterin-guanine dinucleotide biosynthesis protein A